MLLRQNYESNKNIYLSKDFFSFFEKVFGERLFLTFNKMSANSNEIPQDEDNLQGKNSNSTPHSGFRTYFVYFKGEITTWLAYRHPSNFSVTYEQLLTDFLNALSANFNLNYQVDEVILTNLNSMDVVHDLSAKIQPNFNLVDFHVQPTNYKVNDSREQSQLIPPYCYKFVNEGKLLEQQGHYHGAFAFYEVVILHGIRDLSRMLFKTKNWNPLRVYLDHLLCFYPDDEQIFKIAAICYERLGDYKKALEIYNKYQNSSNFMKIGNYRLSPSLRNDKSNFILTVSRALSSQDAYDPFLLEQIIRLSLHFKKIDFGIDCCFRNIKTIKFLSLFTKNAIHYEQIVQKTTKILSEDYRAAIRTAQILFKNGEKSVAIDIARNFRPKKKGGRMMMARLYALLHLLFLDYRFEEMIVRFSKFFSILTLFSTVQVSSNLNIYMPKSKNSNDKNTNLNIYEMLQLLQNIPQFSDKILTNTDFSNISFPQHFNRLVQSIENNNYFLNDEAETKFKDMTVNSYQCDFVDEKKHFLSIVILICGFLFFEGYLDECRVLLKKVEYQINLLSSTFPERKIEYDDTIVRLFTTMRWPFIHYNVIYHSPSAGKVFVFGDEFANVPAYQKFGRNTIVNQFIPRSIPGLTLWELRPNRLAKGKIPDPSLAYIKKRTGNRLTFFDLIDFMAQNYNLSYVGVMLVIGTNDCETVIPKLTKKLTFKTLSDAIDTEVSILLGIIQKIHKMLPKVEIFVHTVMPRFKWSAVIANSFNLKLQEKMPPFAVFVNPFKVDSILDTIELSENLPTYRYPGYISDIIEKIDFQKNH